MRYTKHSKVLIETYRGWEIMFDTDKEEFYTWSNEEDKEQTKRSYASTKKFIDDYINENKVFKPVQVQMDPTSWRGKEIITLIGLRKDGVFMYEDKNGKKRQLSKYDEKEYFLVSEVNEPVFAEIARLKEQEKAIGVKIKEASNKIVKVDITQIRNKHLGIETVESDEEK